MSDDRDYLVKHSIPQVINDLVTALVKDRPPHAVPYMTEWFTKKAVFERPKVPLTPLIKKVCIVGGGNAAQAFANILPSHGVACNMWCGFGDEAERISAGINSQGGMKVHWSDGSVTLGKPDKISKDPGEVVPECNVLIMPLPSFAYPSVLTDLKPHLKPGMYIGITPGQGGFDWVARTVLGEELMKSVIFFAIMPMPLNCRITDFGKQVHVQVLKKKYRVGALPAAKTQECCDITASLFQAETTALPHLLTATMYPINAIIHPQRVFRICQPWRPGNYLPENPLFYEAMDEGSAGLMDAVNTELQMIAEKIKELSGVDLEIPHIKDFLGWVYEDDKPDLTSTKTFFATCSAYKGFRSPLKQVEGKGWVPDFENRYFTEDIPLGLCIYKGIADIVGEKTPAMDMVMYWAQAGMGKEYIVNGKLTGKDVASSNAPQRFGVTTLDQLLGK
uniref:Opine dehydrogenase domain-containing protein n=1 Tax=Eutreptiella gymnastica TaxID=73025 RepID=A0A7S1I9B2_9EUGL